MYMLVPISYMARAFVLLPPPSGNLADPKWRLPTGYVQLLETHPPRCPKARFPGGSSLTPSDPYPIPSYTNLKPDP